VFWESERRMFLLLWPLCGAGSADRAAGTEGSCLRSGNVTCANFQSAFCRLPPSEIL